MSPLLWSVRARMLAVGLAITLLWLGVWWAY